MEKGIEHTQKTHNVNGPEREGSVRGSDMSKHGYVAGIPATQTLGWQPTCGCNADVVPATVLDCFAGSGTTLAVAQELGRGSVGIDLNPEYLALARGRINKTNGITLPMMV